MGLLARHPETPGALRGTRPGVLGGTLGRGRLAGGRRRLPSGALGVEHLEAGERVADRAELFPVARLDERHQRPRALDGLVDLVEVGLRGRLGGWGWISGESRLAGAEVEQRDD